MKTIFYANSIAFLLSRDAKPRTKVLDRGADTSLASEANLASIVDDLRRSDSGSREYEAIKSSA